MFINLGQFKREYGELQEKKEKVTKKINRRKGQDVACKVCDQRFCEERLCGKINNDFRELFRKREKIQEEMDGFSVKQIKTYKIECFFGDESVFVTREGMRISENYVSFWDFLEKEGLKSETESKENHLIYYLETDNKIIRLENITEELMFVENITKENKLFLKTELEKPAEGYCYRMINNEHLYKINNKKGEIVYIGRKYGTIYHTVSNLLESLDMPVRSAKNYID